MASVVKYVAAECLHVSLSQPASAQHNNNMAHQIISSTVFLISSLEEIVWSDPHLHASSDVHVCCHVLTGLDPELM